MSRAFPKEFRRDVVAVARKRESTQEQIAKDFGISHATLSNWLKAANNEDGIVAEAKDSNNDAEVRELKKRNRLLEQEVEILRRAAAYFSRDALPK